MTGPAPGARSYISVDSPFSDVRFGHAWRDEQGRAHATVRLGGSTMTFDDAATARDAARACVKAAAALEALSPSPPDGAS